MNTVILTVSAVIATVLAALFAVPPLVDWNTFRGVFEVEASRLLGRDVRVRGDVRLSILPIPYLQFEDVTVADAPGITGEPFLRANRFTMQLSAPPLLRGAIEASKIEIDGARVRLRLNADGQGNWQQLIAERNPYAIAPTEVSLNEVNFTDASVALERIGGDEIGRVDGISGTLSAPQIEGPYRFVGTIAGDGAESGSEFRVGTGVWSDAGAADFRLALTRKRDGREVIATGQLSAVGDEPFGFSGRIEGDLVLFTGGETALAPEQDADAEDARVQGLVRLDSRALTLDELTIALSGSATPQVLNGSARWELAASEPLRIALTSRLLEFERLGITKVGDGGLALATFAARQIAGLNTTISTLDRPTELSLAIDRLAVGNEALSGIAAQIYVSGNMAELRRFKARVPGATTVVASGDMRLVDGGATAFSGDVHIAGRDLRGFSTWLSPDWGLDRRQAQARFTVRAKLETTGNGWRVSNAQAQVGQTDLRGQLAFNGRDGGDLRLDLTGRTIDLGIFGDNLLRPATLRRFLLEGPSGEGDDAKRIADAVTLRLDAETVRAGSTSLRNVSVDLAREPTGRTAISTLKFTSPGGVELTAAGALEALGDETGARVGGQLSGMITSSAPFALTPALELVGDLGAHSAASGSAGGDFGAVTLPPFSLAYRTSIAAAPSEAAPALLLALDGRVGAETIALELTSSGTVDDLADQPLRFTARASGPDAKVTTDFLRRLLFRPATGVATRGSRAMIGAGTDGAAVPTTMSLVGEGIAREGLVVHAQARSQGTDARYEGSVRVPADGGLHVSGDIRVKAEDASNLLRQWAAPELARRAAGWPLAVDLRFDRSGGASRIELAHLGLGNGSVRGTLAIAETETAADGASARPKVTGQVETGPLQLLELSDAALTMRGPGDASRSPAETPAQALTRSLWPGRRFDLSLFNGLDVDVNVRTPKLSIADATSLEAVRFRLATAPGRVALADIAGSGPLASDVRANLSISDVPGGYRLDGDLAATSMDLARSANADPPGQLIGTASLRARFNGTGLSPRAAIALLRGEGSATLKGVTMAGVAPSSIRAAADAFPADATITAETLQAKLREILGEARTEVGTRDLAVTIRDGALELAPIRFSASGGRIENTSTVDLSGLRAEGRWRLTPAESDDGTERLPAIELIYMGRVGAVATAAPELRTDALLRELVVRRLEGNVAELERLRRLDEERAREQERLRLERERARELARREAEERAARERARQEAASGGRTEGGSEVLPGLDSGTDPVIRQDLPPPALGDQRGEVDNAQTVTPAGQPAPETAPEGSDQASVPAPATEAASPRRAVSRPRPRRRPDEDSWRRGVFLGNQ